MSQYIQIVAIKNKEQTSNVPFASPHQFIYIDPETNKRDYWTPVVGELYTEEEWDNVVGKNLEQIILPYRHNISFDVQIVEVPNEALWYFFGARYCQNERDNLKVIKDRYTIKYEE